MLNLIYAGALSSLLLATALLIMYEKHQKLNRVARVVIILASITYFISIALFTESLPFKSSILVRDLTLMFCVFVSFRIIRKSGILFSLLMSLLIFTITTFGFNTIHNSFKISKFSILKVGSAVNNPALPSYTPSKSPKTKDNN